MTPLDLVHIAASSPNPNIPPKAVWKSTSDKVKIFYLPIFANVFYEPIGKDVYTNRTIYYHPLQLLKRSNQNTPPDHLEDKKLNVAYLYYRCDRKEREALFHKLDGLFDDRVLQVHALGRCPANMRNPLSEENHARSRFNSSYNLDAIAKYVDYEMVIAGENSMLPYYITEKFVNVFLASLDHDKSNGKGSIPIFIGSSVVLKHFNSSAFIFCSYENDFATCLHSITELTKAPQKYLSHYRNSPIFAGNSMKEQLENWLTFFYWHEDAKDSEVYSLYHDAILQIFHDLHVWM